MSSRAPCQTWCMDTLGLVHSPFVEKFGIPRQPGLTRHAHGYVELLSPYNRAEAVRGLGDFSHLWLTFIFHENTRDEWQPTVRPPRLGGNQRVGVFASRSPFRPNGLGLSVVRLESVEIEGARIRLHISGMDLLHGTPIVDIKPYIPYADAIPDATANWAPAAPSSPMRVRYRSDVERWLNQADPQRYPALRALLDDILGQDPRPAYHRDRAEEDRVYGMRLFDLNIRWVVREQTTEVIEIRTDSRPGDGF